MVSRVEALVRNFLRTDGETLVLVPGEKIFILRSGAKVTVGREKLSEESFRAVAHEMAPGKSVSSLFETEYRTLYSSDPSAEPVDVAFGRYEGRESLSILRHPGGSPAAASGAAHPVPLEPSPEPAKVPSPHLPTPSAVRPRPARPSELPARAIDEVLFRMVEMDASDLHLSSGQHPIFRIHGDLIEQEDQPLLHADEVDRLIQQVLPERSRVEFRERNDTDFAYEIAGLARFRVNVFRDFRGPGAVFRQIPLEILTAEDLGLPPAVVKLADLTKGLVLVTGPTGSGKSTTLAALVDLVNRNRREHIITIEDPIEFIHANQLGLVNQREIGSHTANFHSALRAALREDPDVVLVGELRDLETVHIALETAETGHLVFGTLHTTTAASSVDRIVDQFPADRQQQIRVMLADTLRGIVAQTLCRRVGGGRVAALEILLANSAVQNLIREAKTFQIPSVLQTSRAQGMTLLNDSLLALIKQELVEPSEAYRKAVDKPGLVSLFRTNGISFPG
ncbi:MAG: type IV pilus twitching motility protein PilT [Thermoanaerobaculia bacterium]